MSVEIVKVPPSVMGRRSTLYGDLTQAVGRCKIGEGAVWTGKTRGRASVYCSTTLRRYYPNSRFGTRMVDGTLYIVRTS